MPAGPTRGVAVIAVAMCVLLWLAYTEFDDRHWSAFKDAGDRAFGRGNYAYAQRMYKVVKRGWDGLDLKKQRGYNVEAGLRRDLNDRQRTIKE